MKMTFKTFGKDAGTVAMEAGIIAGSAIVSAKFLDFNTLFKNQIAKNPAYIDKWFMKYEGFTKAGGAILIGGAFWKQLPGWAKLLVVGIAVQGGIKGVGDMATAKDGTKFFNPIGQQSNGGADTAALEKLLADAGVSGAGDPPTASYTGVAGAVDIAGGDGMPSTMVSGMGISNYGDFRY